MRLFVFVIIISVVSCKQSGQIDDGLNEVYYEGTDQLKQLVEYKNGKKNGFAKEFYGNGNLKRYQHYINDTLNDSSFYYHPNGQISNKQFFKNKLKHGTWQDFNKEGGLVQELNFKDGVLHGTSTKYTYRTGRVQLRVNYVEGAKQGVEESFYPNGKPKSRVSYNNGWQCAGLQEWDQNGKAIKHDVKINVTEKNEIQLTGKLQYIITLSDPDPADYVYRLYNAKDSCASSTILLRKTDDKHILEYILGKGGFVMDNVTIVAKRRTSMGNTFMKFKSFNVSGNNY